MSWRGEKNPLISALLLSAVSQCNALAELDVSPLSKQCVLIQSQWRERAYDYNGLLLAIIGMKQALRRDVETCELEMSAVHHSILQPTFSLQEQHGCPRITYTDASLQLHTTLLLLKLKLLLVLKKTRLVDQPSSIDRSALVYHWTKSFFIPLKYQASRLFRMDTIITHLPPTYLRRCFSLFWTHKLASPPDSTTVFHSSFIAVARLWLPQCRSNHAAAHHPALFSCLSSLSVFEGPLLFFFFKSPLIQPHVDPPLPATPHPPPAGPLSLVRGPAVRPSPVSAAAVISSGPSGGLLLTSQAWDRVTSSLNMMGLNQQCVRLNREGETKQRRGLSASKQTNDTASQSFLPAEILLCN